MSFTYGFYNSVNGDRMYDASQFGSIFDGVINDGVYMSQGNHFAVNAGSGMNITVGTGRAWFNHTWCLNDSLYPLNISAADLIDPRIDAVVIEVNRDSNVRANSIKMVVGTPGETPRKPAMVHTEFVDQYPLAYVRVPAQATSITQANIENAVGTSATPFVTGVIQTMNIDTLIAQWQAQWQEYIVAREEAMDNWTDAEKAAFQSWEQDTKDEIDLWYQNQQNEFTQWYEEQTGGFETWSSTQMDIFENWSEEQQSAFETWFETIRGILDEDVAGHLQNEIDETFNAVEVDEPNDRLIFTRVDQVQVPVTLSGGHAIYDSEGTKMNKRKGLEFSNVFDVEDDPVNDRTVIGSPFTVVNGKVCIKYEVD